MKIIKIINNVPNRYRYNYVNVIVLLSIHLSQIHTLAVNQMQIVFVSFCNNRKLYRNLYCVCLFPLFVVLLMKKRKKTKHILNLIECCR